MAIHKKLVCPCDSHSAKQFFFLWCNKKSSDEVWLSETISGAWPCQDAILSYVTLSVLKNNTNLLQVLKIEVT